MVQAGDGFGFAKRADGSHEKIVQSGPVVVEDDVEIQTLTSVDRATVGETRVKRGAKLTEALLEMGALDNQRLQAVKRRFDELTGI